MGSAAGRGQQSRGSGFPSWEARADLSRAGPATQAWSSSPCRPPAPRSGYSGLGGPAQRVGRRCPAPLPAHLRLARSPAASTGNNRGPQRPPMQALLRGRPGREGGHCRSLFRFPQHCLGSKRPLGANKASPQPAAVQPPSARPWGQAHQAPGLLKWQVQGRNEVMSKSGLGGCLWARAGQASRQMGTGVRVYTRVSPAPGPTAGV